MVEISSYGSGEGLGRATAQPTLQRDFSAPPLQHLHIGPKSHCSPGPTLVEFCPRQTVPKHCRIDA